MDQVATIVAVFGTRPEIIKLEPVLRALADKSDIKTVLVSTGQQRDLIPAFLDDFGLHIDESLDAMVAGQSLNESLASMLAALDAVLARTQPDLVVVQGDTTSALAGALSARFRAVPVAHIEAGLRTGDPASPFPEETNRRLITHTASLHLAPTPRNVSALLAEGIPKQDIVKTGNPVVDAVEAIRAHSTNTSGLDALLAPVSERKIVVLTLHRRENFGKRLTGYIDVIKGFIETNPDCALVVPVHPNPVVREAIYSRLDNVPGVVLLAPLPYAEFFCLLERAWLVLSDSGGIQEEVVTLGKPLLILRDRTERPEAVDAGAARLAATPADLAVALGSAKTQDNWSHGVKSAVNPFGDGHSGERIARALHSYLIRSTMPESDGRG